jgi:hypothetical protein
VEGLKEEYLREVELTPEWQPFPFDRSSVVPIRRLTDEEYLQQEEDMRRELAHIMRLQPHDEDGVRLVSYEDDKFKKPPKRRKKHQHLDALRGMICNSYILLRMLIKLHVVLMCETTGASSQFRREPWRNWKPIVAKRKVKKET